jgi:phosphoglycolate phosphatase-like HAD superfamily hydrolase
MKTQITDFERSKDWLVCIDSDGCAMDTMEVKHRKCFGPMAVKVWALEDVADKFLNVWNNVNLYSSTRGINRFKGLVKTFEEMEALGYQMPDFEEIKKWTEETSELSNPALVRAIENTGSLQLNLTLTWSLKVNESIESLAGEDRPFPKVLEGLAAIYPRADIAIISSANGKAVVEEWTRHGLARYVELMCGQEAGSKAYCIGAVKTLGDYHSDNVLMVGDSPGDLAAAKDNGVLFYPIIAGDEASSWETLSESAIEKFIDGTFSGDYQDSLISKFNKSLSPDS